MKQKGRRYIEGESGMQGRLLPLRFIRIFAESLDLKGIGFVRARAAHTGRPGYNHMKIEYMDLPRWTLSYYKSKCFDNVSNICSLVSLSKSVRVYVKKPVFAQSILIGGSYVDQELKFSKVASGSFVRLI